jgi:DNA ligase-1
MKSILHIVLAVISFCLALQAFAQSPESRALLANVANADIDPTPYLVSEKYDGVRALWDGNALHTRTGNIIAAPAWFTKKLPKLPLDGELWMARGQFEKLSGAVRKTIPQDDEWRQIRYMVFELPDAPGTFAERYEKIKGIVAEAGFAQLVTVEQFRLPNNTALRRKLAEIVAAGGEGLMLHRADAPYVTGRNDALLKLKPLDDAEAIVTGYIPGKGKYAGKMGALQVQTADGRRFQIGTGFSDEIRANPPAIGATVTYTFRGLTKNGLPRFASFWRVREKF